MRKFLLSRGADLLIWTPLVALLLFRPPNWEPFVSLLGIAVVVVGWQRNRTVVTSSEQAWQEWEGRLHSLRPTMDIDDDGHLYEWLDPPQWEQVFIELERMPQGSRSLRKAFGVVAPELVA